MAHIAPVCVRYRSNETLYRGVFTHSRLCVYRDFPMPKPCILGLSGMFAHQDGMDYSLGGGGGERNKMVWIEPRVNLDLGGRIDRSVGLYRQREF